MKGANVNLPDDDNLIGNLDAEELATNQESTPIPYFCGEQRCAVRWITGILNQYHIKVRDEGGGKGK